MDNIDVEKEVYQFLNKVKKSGKIDLYMNLSNDLVNHFIKRFGTKKELQEFSEEDFIYMLQDALNHVINTKKYIDLKSIFTTHDYELYLAMVVGLMRDSNE